MQVFEKAKHLSSDKDFCWLGCIPGDHTTLFSGEF